MRRTVTLPVIATATRPATTGHTAITDATTTTIGIIAAGKWDDVSSRSHAEQVVHVDNSHGATIVDDEKCGDATL